MNNKAELGEQMYVIYFIFLLIIITVGIVAGSYSAFGKPYDSTKVDSSLLVNRVAECLQNVPALSEIRMKDAVIGCGIDEKLLEKGFVLALYINGKEISKYGNVIACGLQDKYSNGPKCTFKTIELNVDNSLKEVGIIAGSNIR